MTKTLLYLFAFLFITTACQHKVEFDKGNAPTGSSEAGGKGLVGKVVWVKHKSNSLDILIELGNEYNFPVSYKASSVTFEFDGKKVGVRGNPASDIAPEVYGDKLFILAFKDEMAKGKGILTIEPMKEDGKKLPPLKIEVPFPKG